MTRTECEEKILDLMEKIRDTVKAYNPDINRLSCAVCNGSVWAFELEQDDKGEPITGQYLLNAWRKTDE